MNGCRTALLLAASLLTVVACGSEEGDSQEGGGGTGNVGGSGGEGGVLDPLPPPEVGMQLQSTPYTLAPGAEEYQCWSFQIPEDEPLAVVGLEQQAPPNGVHHFAVFTNTQPYEEAGPWECETMGISWGLVSGGGVGTPGVSFPEGTAMTLEGGKHVILQLHIINAGADPLEIQPTYVNLLGSNATDLQKVGLLIAGTLDIDIPAQSTGVDATGGCTIDEPMQNIFAVFPHMHQLGRRTTVDLTPADGSAKQTLSDQTWDFKDQGLYPIEGSAVVGDRIDVTCQYDNSSDANVEFGLSSSDEMCVNVLYYYPATTPSKYCGLN
ncbi:MAG: hypothetical protein HOW73_33115 [Polyangiaceae bacterium]|nr:hypothetical protein [Polyangiaceae bacterium]